MRKNVALCLILFGLIFSGYIEKQAVPRDTGARVTEPAGEKLLTTSMDQVMALRFKDPRGCLVLSQSDIWRVEGGPETKVDTDAIIQLLSTIETARVIRKFDCDPLELAQYGLTTPSLVIGVRRRGEEGFHNLLLGDKNPVGSAVYAKWAHSPQVLMTGAYFETLVKMMIRRIREG